jgi:hypothetical protein
MFKPVQDSLNILFRSQAGNCTLKTEQRYEEKSKATEGAALEITRQARKNSEQCGTLIY